MNLPLIPVQICLAHLAAHGLSVTIGPAAAAAGISPTVQPKAAPAPTVQTPAAKPEKGAPHGRDAATGEPLAPYGWLMNSDGTRRRPRKSAGGRPAGSTNKATPAAAQPAAQPAKATPAAPTVQTPAAGGFSLASLQAVTIADPFAPKHVAPAPSVNQATLTTPLLTAAQSDAMFAELSAESFGG